MAQDWPTSLPQAFQKSDFQDTPQSGVIRTDMSSGYPKIRRRFTAVTRTYTGTMILTETQRQTFETFFNTTLLVGSDIVNFPDPYNTSSLVAMRWVPNSPPYTIQQDGETLDWRLSFAIERLP